ncbi:MAG: DUF423 domain-containing protein [Balneolaceae bacterium]
MAQLFLIIGAVAMALAVGFGAFGAHIVQDILTPERYAVYKTAVEYHFYHAIGLLIVGVTAFHIPESHLLNWSGWLLLAGILIFSGSLYLLTLTDTSWLGAITPLGGFAFIAGWIVFALALIRQQL